MSEKRVYRVYEIQEILGIVNGQHTRLSVRDYFRSVRIGDHIRISKKSFDKWFASICEGISA